MQVRLKLVTFICSPAYSSSSYSKVGTYFYFSYNENPCFMYYNL